jgi:hypothetical protein
VNALPSREQILAVLKYDRSAGRFFWRAGARCGQRAGAVATKGYRQIKIAGRSYMEHRLAFVIVHGRAPAALVDHRNHRKADNRARNLRDYTRSQNGQHRRAKSRNRAGLLGVYKVHRPNAVRPYRALIRVEGKLRHLGVFKSARAAQAAYIAAKRIHHPAGEL